MLTILEIYYGKILIHKKKNDSVSGFSVLKYLQTRLQRRKLTVLTCVGQPKSLWWRVVKILKAR